MSHTGTREFFATAATSSVVGCTTGCNGTTAPWTAHCHALDHKSGGRRACPHRGQTGSPLMGERSRLSARSVNPTAGRDSMLDAILVHL
jgi:hypothetical protein